MNRDTGPVGNVIAAVVIGALPGGWMLAATIDHVHPMLSWAASLVVCTMFAGAAWVVIDWREERKSDHEA